MCPCPHVSEEEQLVGVSVPQIMEQIVDIGKVIPQRSSQRIVQRAVGPSPASPPPKNWQHLQSRSK